MLIGGYDTKLQKPVLNWIDYLAANVTLPYAAHGYASYYVLSLLDRHHKPGLTLEEGMELMGLCVEEIKRRIPMDFKGIQVSYIIFRMLISILTMSQIRVVDKDGIHEHPTL